MARSRIVAYGKVGVAIAEELHNVMRSDKRAVARVYSEWPIRFELAAKGYYPATGLQRRSGHLWGSIKGFSRYAGAGNVVVGLQNKMKYAWFHEYGSRPHYIAPRGAHAGGSNRLAFKGRGGKQIILPPGRVVKHPGTKARRFLRDPIRKTAPKLIKALKDEIGFS